MIALRDLARYVDPERTPPDPLAIVERRKSERKEVLVEGQVVNAADGRAVPARVSIQSADGAWHFVKTGFGRGSAVRYERRSGFNTNAVEMHTTLPASPFRVELFPGRCTFAVEHGKEFFGETREVEVAPGMAELTFRLRRWVDMAELGWFCGDTHVHREPADLANVMPAEDVNVAFPMVYWTTDADIAPGRGDKNIKGEFPAAPVALDATHVYYPRNTEYEIFTTGGRSHTLGALLALNHRTVFDLPALPIGRVAERAHAEGALLDLEKHNWPWSMALVPLVRPDLFELANNHHWQTAFSITNWAVSAPAWMQVGRGSDNEREWTLYGFLNYYALLDCGFRLSPAAGTANGVHPVSLGFSRVYVHLPRGFSYDAWVNGLKAGHSFVTTGPMLLATVNGEDAGYTFKIVPPTNGPQRFRVKGDVVSAEPSRKIEIIVNGQAVRTINAVPDRLPSGAHNSHFDEVVELAGSGWIAARCWEERAEGRFRFAHTAPWFVDMAGRPLRPRREEAEFLVKRTEEEIARNSTVLSSEALADYRRALSAYRDIARTAK